jgi:peptidoglycan-associated lipoprotein
MLNKTLLILLSVAALSACETPGVKPNTDDVNGIDGTGTTETNGIDTIGVEGGSEFGDGTSTFVLSECEPDCEYPVSALSNPESMLAKRLVFFGLNSDEITDEFSNTLIAHGKYLASNPGVKLRLEGHTDERGTREYNLALSERRAQAVRRFLMLYGARSESVSVYGFGEELPLALGSNDTAWSENRRAELVYDSNN